MIVFCQDADPLIFRGKYKNSLSEDLRKQVERRFHDIHMQILPMPVWAEDGIVKYYSELREVAYNVAELSVIIENSITVRKWSWKK